MQKCLEKGTGWPREPREMQASNVRNLLSQLNSIYEVGKLWEAHYAERRYEAIIFARPDVKFTCPFPATLLDRMQVCSAILESLYSVAFPARPDPQDSK